MGRFIADQNKVLLIQESGTYAFTSGTAQWIGQVTEHTVTDEENLIVTRYLGTTNRSFETTDNGPRNVNGTVTFFPQDMRLMFMGMGSIRDISGTTATNSEHSVTQIDTNVTQNPFTSGTGDLDAPFAFTLEDSKQSVGTGKNFVRTIRGCVPTSTTLTISQGEKVTVEVNYIGQTAVYTSGNTTVLTENTDRSYLWSDATLTVAGSVLQTVKEIVFEVNQNVEGPHYLNGSRDIAVPFPGNRDYTLTVTTDLDADEGDLLYDDLYKNNTIFNCTLALDTQKSTGSQEAFFVFSGCRIVNTPDVGTALEGVNEATFEITPQNVTGSSFDSNAGNYEYNPY